VQAQGGGRARGKRGNAAKNLLQIQPEGGEGRKKSGTVEEG